MPIAAVAIAAVGLGLSVYQTVDAKKRQKEAEQAAKEFERQELKNPYENLQVSTLGAELQQQNLNNQVTTATDVLRAGGSRAVLGGLPSIYDNIIQANQQIAAGLDQQYNQNQQLIAGGAINVQNMQEQRDNADLLGIGNAINTARQEYNQGLTSIVQSGAALAQAGISAGSSSSGNQSSKTSASATPTLGSTPGFFSSGRNAVAIRSNNLNSQPIVSTPRVSINQPYYQDLINTYNRNLYGNRGF